MVGVERVVCTRLDVTETKFYVLNDTQEKMDDVRQLTCGRCMARAVSERLLRVRPAVFQPPTRTEQKTSQLCLSKAMHTQCRLGKNLYEYAYTFYLFYGRNS